jgi:tetratricopeptide (TPR) repeat protein
VRRDRATSMGFALVALASAALACKASPPKPELFGVFRGCTEIKADRTCLYTSGSTLTVWFDASASSKVEVQIDGDEVATKLIPAEDGARLELPLEDHAERVRVDMKGGRFELPLKWVQTATPAEAGPREAYRLHQAGLRALRRGDAEKAHHLLEEAEDLARNSKLAHRWREIAYALTYLEITTLGQLSEAERRRRDLPLGASFDGRSRVLMGWLRGFVAWRLGDRRTAHRELDDAIRWARRLGDPALRDAASLGGLLLLESGRAAEAVEIFDELSRLSTPGGCQWSTDILNAGWARLMLKRPDDTRAAARLFEAGIHASKRSCADEDTRNHHIINLALAHLELQDSAEASVWLEQANATQDPVQRLWIALLGARLELALGQTESAADAFVRLAQRASRTRYEALEWRARLGAGRAYREGLKVTKAEEQYRLAEDILGRQAFLMPARQGRFAWLNERSESARELVTVLLGRGADLEAFTVARRARRRAYLTLAAIAEVHRLHGADGSEWAHSVAAVEEAREALASYRANEAWATAEQDVGRADAKERALATAVDHTMETALALLRPRTPTRDPAFAAGDLVTLPIETDRGPTLFVRTANGISVRPLDKGIAAAIDDVELSEAARILVLADRPETAASLARDLRVQIPVAFGLDLGPSHAPTRASNQLIVSDPRRDLVAARREASQIEHLYPQRSLVHISGRSATRSAVIEAVQNADAFHFAGHGRSAGPEGWDSALLLADTELSVGDVLLLRSVPRRVILSGCETAKTGTLDEGGIGVAQAFAIAGSEVVIATHREVDSADALAYATALHGRISADQSNLLAAHQVALRAVGEAADAFVLLVR